MKSLTRWFPMFPAKLSPIISVGLLLMLAIACGPAATLEPLPPSPTPPGPTPTPVMLEKPAPIHEVRIEVSDTDSSKADLVVVSGLPNACYKFGHYEIERDGNFSFQVKIVNLLPDDPMMACAEIYGMVTTRIPLEGGVETCKLYDVTVNDELYSVQAIAPNVRCADPNSSNRNEAQLPFGEKTLFDWNDLELTLVDVTEDSRCPSDVTCIWAGQATAVIKVDLYGKELGQYSLTLGEDPDAAKVAVDNYTIELVSLEPYPVSTVESAKTDYVAMVVIGLNSESEGVQELKPAN